MKPLFNMTIRCADCGIPIKRKSHKGRAPKYCAKCRSLRQEPYRRKK